MTRLDKLWRAVIGPGTPPVVDSARVKARVNAALDAGCLERKMFMKRKLCAALAAAAVILAVTGTALAAAAHWDALSAWFRGDNAPGQAYLDSEVRTVSDENYTLTVESAAADENSVFLVVSITAVSDEAKTFLYSDEFVSMDMLNAWASKDWDGGIDAGPPVVDGAAIRELKSDEENCRRFAMDIETASAAKAVFVRCGYMEKDKKAEIPITAAPSVTVKIVASGDGILYLYPASALNSVTMTVKEITLTPFTCRVELKRSNYEVYPRILFRMKDGSIRTQAQMMEHTSANSYDINYRFHQVQNLDDISSVIVFDMEYPLDGSAPTPVEHDPSLDPVMVKWMERLEGGSAHSLSAQELTEKLGGTFSQDPATGEAVCVYRGVTIVLQTGSAAALVDGKTVMMDCAPAMLNGVLAAPHGVFEDAWELDFSGLREYVKNSDGTEHIVWLDWYVVP